jgi:hypothetical protein
VGRRRCCWWLPAETLRLMGRGGSSSRELSVVVVSEVRRVCRLLLCGGMEGGLVEVSDFVRSSVMRRARFSFSWMRAETPRRPKRVSLQCQMKKMTWKRL